MSRIRVPLSVDAELGLDIGAVRVPYRALATFGAAIPPGFLILHLGLPFGLGITLASLVAVAAIAVAVPDREGIWVVSYWLGRLGQVVTAGQRDGGTWSRGPIEVVELGTVARGTPRTPTRHLGPLAQWMDPPRVLDAADGLLHLDPGGWRAVLRLEGPPAAPESSAYRAWCEAATRWLLALECPAQLITEVGHLDRAEAERAWEGASCFRPADGPLALHERVFAGDMAQHSLAFTHHVVLAPRSAGGDGIPRACSPLRGPRAEPASRTDAERILEAALHRAEERGLVASAVGAGADMRRLLGETILGDGPAAVVPEGVWVGGVHLGLLAVTGLPPDVDFGVCVRAVQRAGIRGTVSLHVLPASPDGVRTALRQQRALLRRTLEQRCQEEDVAVALEDVRQLQADIAAGNVIGLRLALAFAVKARLRSECAIGTERMAKLLEGEGFGVVPPTVPGLRPAMSVAPGLPPLRRALHLTTDAVLARLLPVLATPFSDAGAPIVGRNVRTGATAHLGLWSRSNANALVVGSSGSGKSLALKVWPLVRHHMQGANAVVIDPESEFEPVIRLLGGRYHELGADALNPLGFATHVGADDAAGLIVSVLSVMGGDTVDYVGGRPVRRLPSEDKAWLKREVHRFLLARKNATKEREPVLGELLACLAETIAADRTLGETRRDRYGSICLRLGEYTSGALGRIFNRRSSFRIEPGVPIGIGLRSLSVGYAADQTPAMAVALTHVIDAVVQARERLLVIVDEAHVLTSDPDAGEVVEQLLRRARKYSAGILMASQAIDEFVSTRLGRTLATVAATKLVLGVEETVADRVREVFGLAPDEVAALTPPHPGRGVLIAGAERTIVQVEPSPILWPFVRSDRNDGVAGEVA